MEITSGATRTVLLVGKLAFKLPRLGPYRNFLQGLLANQQERVFSGMRGAALCPVWLYVPGGWLVVMPRLVPISDDQWERVQKNWEWGDLVECKRSSFGARGDSVLAIDYGS